jgi:hypothetical protein
MPLDLQRGNLNVLRQPWDLEHVTVSARFPGIDLTLIVDYAAVSRRQAVLSDPGRRSQSHEPAKPAHCGGSMMGLSKRVCRPIRQSHG